MKRDNSYLSNWWWTIDRHFLYLTLTLMTFGVLINFTASPAVALKIDLPPLFFAIKHIKLIILSLIFMIIISFLSLQNITYLGFIGYSISIILLIITFFYGLEIKGAKRWINFSGFCLQSSEVLKPFFCVLCAYYLEQKKYLVSFILFFLPLCLMVIQPDLGMSFTLITIYLAQLFLLGVPILFFITLFLISIMGLFIAYLYFPHVNHRLNQFLFSDKIGDSFQISQSLKAFQKGGFLGIGPGEGNIKYHIPDVHADFVFSVIGEEFGFITCTMILCLFFIVIVKMLFSAKKNINLFKSLTIIGISTQFSFQTLVNIASTINIIPTKGMTLPFLSYGGSSLFSFGIGFGIILALTRKSQIIE